MKQVVINIPDNKYLDFINHIRSKFSDIQIFKTNEVIEEVLMKQCFYLKKVWPKTGFLMKITVGTKFYKF